MPQQPQSRGTGGGHSIHQCAATGRNHCASGTRLLLRNDCLPIHRHKVMCWKCRFPFPTQPRQDSPYLFLRIMQIKARDGEDIGCSSDRQPLNSMETLAEGWIQLLLRKDKIAQGPHLIMDYLIAPLDLGLCVNVQLPSNAYNNQISNFACGGDAQKWMGFFPILIIMCVS